MAEQATSTSGATETQVTPSSPAPDLEVDSLTTETDSAYGDELSVYTASVTSSVTDFYEENGRRYHAYREGRYLLPNDEKENERLDIHHALIQAAMDDRLFLAPIGDKHQRVLDICTGTGIWAIEFADQFPSAEVLGNDLSPTQPTFVPPNVKFLVDDVEDEWGYEDEPFDFIHARYLVGSVKDMKRLIKQAYACTKPGGWAEFQDWDVNPYSPDGTVKGTSVERYMTLMANVFQKAGYTTLIGRHLEEWMKETGFINVGVQRLILPLGTWPKDKKYKRIGAFNLVQYLETLEANAMAALTRVEGWSKQEVEVLVAHTRADAKNPKVHTQFDFYVVWGQKPQ
ncbi:hypothetical protein FQN54_005353 [Arachnomyces sp. PD_36]|nr:hypothetical protein FQN54_005353 [Arachnomyces sp. PD_36]